MLRSQDGFTVLELIVVMLIIAILSAIAISFHARAREQASDATAKTNLRIALPAIEAYRHDNGTYGGMTLAALQATYSPGVTGIEVVSASETAYCVRATVGDRNWYREGPDGPLTTIPCS